jgi:hypothetical protein
MDQGLIPRMANAHAGAAKIGANMGHDGADTIMPGCAAARLHAKPARGKIELIVKGHNLIGRGLIELGCLGNGAAAFIHIGLGLHEKASHLASGRVDIAFADLGLKLGPPRAKPPPAGQFVHGKKANIVPIALILAPGIAQARQDQHAMPSQGIAQ